MATFFSSYKQSLLFIINRKIIKSIFQENGNSIAVLGQLQRKKKEIKIMCQEYITKPFLTQSELCNKISLLNKFKFDVQLNHFETHLKSQFQ